jgi:3-hydroxyisobutyrate dehydrogenase-like beta-hydroxyacid dehydrogenase
MTMARVGFLVLGSMGQAMARRLIDAGHDVVVWNRSAGPRDELASLGATAVETPAEATAEEAGISLPTNSLLRELSETALADPELAGKDWSAVAEITFNQNKG